MAEIEVAVTVASSVEVLEPGARTRGSAPAPRSRGG